MRPSVLDIKKTTIGALLGAALTPASKLWTPAKELILDYPKNIGAQMMGLLDLKGGRVGNRKELELDFDPLVLGYDRKRYRTNGIITQETDTLVYAASGADATALSRNRVITAIMLVADPYQHDVTTGTITVVQDAVDKLISNINIAGGPTYFSLNNTPLYMKAISNLNKQVHNVGHEDLATAVAANNQSYQAWLLKFGALSDKDPFDVTAGIPAQDEASLNLAVTFGANNIIAVTAADGTVDVATTVYVITFGVSGLPVQYRRFLPLPDFRHSHVTSPGSTVTHDLLGGRYLKRTTVVNLAVVASNNEDRNDSNITDMSIILNKPTRIAMLDTIRWRAVKDIFQPWENGVSIDRDGSAAVSPGGLAGIAVLDWRKLTHNPYGLNTYGFQDGDYQLVFNLGTTDGSLHFFHEYYTLPNPAVAEHWGPYR